MDDLMNYNILVISTQPQRFLDQLEMYKSMVKKNNDLKIKFFINDLVYTTYTKEIEKHQLDIINYPKKIINKKFSIINKIKSNKILLKILNLIKLSFICNNCLKKKENRYYMFLIKNYKKYKELVEKYDINVILLNGDRHIDEEQIFLKISQELNIPSIIVYLVWFSDDKTLFKTKKRIKKYKNNFFLSKYVKDSQKNLNYELVSNRYFYEHYIANALQKFGTLSENPYIMGRGKSSVVCLPNDYLKKLYTQKGVNPNKIRVIGDISYDKLYYSYIQKEHIKNDIINKYNLNKNKKIVLIALPQLAEHNILSWNEHWKEINFLMYNLNKLNENILISLHPKMKLEHYKFLEEKYNCNILDERLVDILPISDIFIATFSSTVLWSVLCGIKTIVVDFYGLDYDIYNFLESIEKINEKSKFLDSVKKIINRNINFSKDWESLSRTKVFDGKTIDRYIQIIKGLEFE